ncbi:MAG: hypothetical protein ABFS86_10520, partial [Planctomycetota bacterium]
LRARNYEQAYNALDESYRAQHTLEEFTAEMNAAFPGSEPLVLAGETIAVRADDYTEQEKADLTAFFKAKETDELDHVSRIVATEGPAPTNVDIRLMIRRNGYADYSVSVISLRAWPAPESPAVPEDTSPETSPSKGTSADEDQPK